MVRYEPLTLRCDIGAIFTPQSLCPVGRRLEDVKVGGYFRISVVGLGWIKDF